MNDGGKGSAQRPTNHKKWSSGYDNIKWTKEEDEEFDRISAIQDNPSAKCTVALPAIAGQRAKAS